jgi:hypothetical protein
MTKVVHCKKEAYDVYIGRPSKWGNPFEIGKDGNREQVLQKYQVWIMKNEKLLADLHELKDKTLGCWCKPKGCHGDILALLADHIRKEPV